MPLPRASRKMKFWRTGRGRPDSSEMKTPRPRGTHENRIVKRELLEPRLKSNELPSVVDVNRIEPIQRKCSQPLAIGRKQGNWYLSPE